MDRSVLFGTWAVKSFQAVTGLEITYPLGRSPAGFVGFSPRRFWALLFNSGWEKPQSALLSDADAVALMRSSAAYTGKYALAQNQTPDDVRLTIDVDASVNEALVGTERVFFLTLHGSGLVFKSPGVITPDGRTSSVELLFEKIE